jgi:hypothetical protein
LDVGVSVTQRVTNDVDRTQHVAAKNWQDRPERVEITSRSALAFSSAMIVMLITITRR